MAPSRINHGASVKDVADAAGVSLGTVSNTLNRPHLVSRATRDRVMRAIEELGFVRNESARMLRAGTSNTLGYVMMDATNPFFTDVGQSIERAAEGENMSLFLCNSDGRAVREATHLERLEQQRVKAILITPVQPDLRRLREIVQRGTRVVLVDHRSAEEDFCSVSVDDVTGGRLAVEHLIETGRRRVAFIGGPMGVDQVAARWAGARAAWDDAALPPEDLSLVETAGLTVEDGRSAGERVSGLPARRRPEGVLCANDLLALGVLQQQMAAGRRVPDDLAIVGYDDILFAAAAAVPLTSVRQPRELLGRTGAELALAEVAEDPHTHRQVVFQPELIARASTIA
jgi:LacI family transcriptional regulator